MKNNFNDYQEEKRYTYVFVRKDLPLHTQIVQSCHAAQECGIHLSIEDFRNYLIVLEVKSERQLLKIREQLLAQGIKTILFREPDIGNEATAMATTQIPINNKDIFKRYRLWKGKE